MLAPALGSGVGTLRAAGIGLWVVALVANPMVLSLLLTGYSPFRDPFSNVTTGLLTVYLVARVDVGGGTQSFKRVVLEEVEPQAGEIKDQVDKRA